MTNLEEIRNILKEADSRLVELQLARTKVEEAKARAEQTLSKAMRLSVALVKAADNDEPEKPSVPRPHVAGLFRSASTPSEAGQFASAR